MAARRALNPNLTATMAPPVMAARRWLEEVALPPGLPLINVSQAAPVAPPPEGLRQAIARAALEDDSAHIYGPVLGLPALREEIARQWSAAYGGKIAAANVAITSGCNQAFAAAIATLAGPGDEVILPVPWYFNHKMWLDMQGIATRPLPAGAGLLPDPQEAARLITPRTRALVLVTPNNPGGAEYPQALMEAFFDLARAQGLALIIDETYRDFHSSDGAPHALFRRAGWEETLIQLYSFSKAYRLTGHRVGALIAGPARLAEVEKFLDTVTICPNQLAQRAALWGMRNLGEWLAGERREILARRAAMAEAIAGLDGWRLLGAGAYFAYAEHPFAMPSGKLAPQILREAGVLLLPGEMFRPEDDPAGAREIRIAFANIDTAAIATLAKRLAALPLPRA